MAMKKPSSKGLRVYRVELNPEVKGLAFEKFMGAKVLENIKAKNSGLTLDY